MIAPPDAEHFNAFVKWGIKAHDKAVEQLNSNFGTEWTFDMDGRRVKISVHVMRPEDDDD